MTLKELAKYEPEYVEIGIDPFPEYTKWCETHCIHCERVLAEGEMCFCWNNGVRFDREY